MATDPRDNPDAFDHPTLDGQPMPGTVVVRTAGGERGAKVEQVQSPGFAGAFTKPAVVEDMATITYRVDCATKADRADTRPWLEMLRKGQKQKPKCRVYRFADPALEHCEIRSVILQNMTGWEKAKSGMWSVSVTFAEWKKRVPMPTGAAPRAKTDIEVKIEALNAENKQLEAQLAAQKKGK